MRSLGLAVCVVLALPVAGCGSGSSTPPFSLSCTIRTLTSGAIASTLSVTNNTGNAATAYLYGPAFSWITYIHPVSPPAEVVVQVPRGPQPFRGFAIPNVSTKTPSHLELRFRPPASPQGITVSATQRFKADDLSSVTGSGCQIKR